MKSVHARRLLVSGLAATFLAASIAPAAGAAAAPAKPASATAKPAVKAAALKTSSYFVYRTFTKDKRVSAFPCEIAGQFGGDNRSYSTRDDRSSRTVMVFGVNWNTSKTYTSKSVGKSTYYLNGKLKSTKTASTKNMKFTNIKFKGSSSARRVTFTLDHSATNPHCGVGAITYKVTVTLYRTGKVVLSGTRRKVPHHEAFVYHNRIGGDRKFILRKQNHGFNCLVGGMCVEEKLDTTVSTS